MLWSKVNSFGFGFGFDFGFGFGFDFGFFHYLVDVSSLMFQV